MGAVYGIVAMLRRLRSDGKLNEGATLGAVVFDAPGKTFRDEWYPQYKANRTETPPDLARQIPLIHEFVKASGWPLIVREGIEADDVIGTLATQATRAGWRTVIGTGDKDMAQLVNDRVVLLNTMTRDTGPVERLDAAGVQAKFGVPPERIVDYLTLVGDSVDNVPGVNKVGPKTAVKWLAEYGSLDGVVAQADKIGGVVGQNLRAALDWLPMGRKLVTIKLDCDLTDELPDLEHGLALRPEDDAQLLALYERGGFRTWRRELEERLARAGTPLANGSTAANGAAMLPVDGTAVPGGGSDQAAGGMGVGEGAAAEGQGGESMTGERAGVAVAVVADGPVAEYECVLTLEALDRWIALIDGAPLTAFDTETTSLDPMRAQLVGLSLSIEPGKACYVPVAHVYPGAPDQLSREVVLDRLRGWLQSDAHKKVGQHLKYDAHVLANHGVALAGIEHDTMLESYVLEPHRNHNMDSLALRHLDRKTITYEEVAGKGAKQIGFDQVGLEQATMYAAEDADITLQLHLALYPSIRDDAKLEYVYRDIEIPTARVLQRIERNGVLIDAELLTRQSDELGRKMLALEQQAYEAAGQPFNLGSPKQLGELLFDKLGLPIVKKTATGAPSTDEEVLSRLAADYPLPRIVLEHRGLSKLKSTYTDKLPRMVNPSTGRVHTSYGQAIAVTGRLASNDPNLQNIPIRTAEGRRIREAFIAPPDSVIMSADYSQIELRIMAHISGDEGLTRAFAEGLDVHRATASEVFGVPVAEVSAEQRRYAKTINFGLIYGMSAFGLAASLHIERDAAKHYIERYFARYPGVQRYMENTRQQAKAQGYVETVFGRRLWLAEINSPNGPRRQAAERAAINAPMQGTAADLVKMAMIQVQGWLDTQALAAKLIMQVHDELVLEVPQAELDRVRDGVTTLMTNVATLHVPLEVGVGIGPNWDQAH